MTLANTTILSFCTGSRDKGGFAAALALSKDPVWVMNVVPVEANVNTLGVIYERGLIGTYQNWCEANVDLSKNI
ncbi:probable methyltransferase PMT15 [Tanacetum coccineum]